MSRTLALLLRRAGWLALGVVLVAFSVVNRGLVPVSLPLLGSVDIPLFLVFYSGLFFGLIVAGMVTGWMRLKGFTRRRQAERRARHLEKQMADISEDAHRYRAEQAHSHATDRDSVPDEGPALTRR